MEPKSPKGSQKGDKGSEKGATWRPKGAKSEPRGDQNASKNRSSEKIAKREPKGSPRQDEMGPFWEPCSIKTAIENSFKNRSRKNRENNGKRLPTWSQNRCQNSSKINAKTGIEKDQERHEI